MTELASPNSKRIFLALDDHTDYMWTADEETYRQAILEMLDYYIEQVEQTAGSPPDFQSRFCCDGHFWAWVYEQNRPPAAFQKLIECIRSGHISLPLNPLILTYGGAPLEAALRGMFYAGRLERRNHLRLPLALSIENQTMPFGLGALWAGSGAKYSWKGICACASHVIDAWDRPHDIYWWTGPDGSRLLMKWNSLLVDNKNLGGYAEGRDPQASLLHVETNAEFQRRYPYGVIGIFGKGWDDLKTLSQEFVAFARMHSTPERRVIVSNEVDFFEDFSAQYGDMLPSESSAYGNEWDLYTASLAGLFGQVRRAVEGLRTAEALQVLAGSSAPVPRTAAHAQDRSQVWMNLGLLYEHDLTADGPVSREERAAWQRRMGAGIIQHSRQLLSGGVGVLGKLIGRTGSLPRFFVFNPLSWAVSGAADLPYSCSQPCHVVDLLTGLEVPSQQIERGERVVLQILAQDVPPVGYKVFEVRPGMGTTFALAGWFVDRVLENEFTRLVFSETGAVISWVDKTAGDRELARLLDGRGINDLGAPGARMLLEHCGPVSLTVRVEAEQPVAHTRRYTLLRGQPWVALQNEILQNFGDELAWDFPFNFENPRVWHEEVGAVICARLHRDGGHYAEKCARYDWLTLNHFVDMSDGGSGAGVTLSNADCAFMQLGRSSIKHLDIKMPRVRVLVGGQVDGPRLGIPNQGGDAYFLQRFALRPHRGYDPVQAMRFALEHQNPLVCGPVEGGSQYPQDAWSLVQIDHPGVLLWALKPAEDGWEAGIVARLWNLTDAPAAFTLSLTGLPIRRAQTLTHLETPVGDAAVQAGSLTGRLAPQQLGTFGLIVA